MVLVVDAWDDARHYISEDLANRHEQISYADMMVATTRIATMSCFGLPRSDILWLKDGRPLDICHEIQVRVRSISLVGGLVWLSKEQTTPT